MVKTFLKKILFYPTSPHITKFIFDLLHFQREEYRGDTNVDLSQIKKVLVIRLDQIGDVVMTAPSLRELRRNLPNAWITLVVNPSILNLVENCPYVDEVLASDWEGDRDAHRFRRHWRAWKMGLKQLWHRKFDLAIVPRRDADQSHGAFLSYFSGARYRVGYSDIYFETKLPYYRNNNCLLTHVVDANNIKHEVESSLDLIRYMGGVVKSDKLEIWLSPHDEQFAEQVLSSHEIQPQDLLVGIAPGAAHPKRMWPLERFVALGNWLHNKYNAAIVLVGGPGEELLGQQIAQNINERIVNIIGKATLRQTAAVLKSCNIFIGNDSGPMHLAAAAGGPVVEISAHPLNGSPYDASSPVRFGPWGVPHIILQPEKATPPCTNACTAERPHCILNVTVNQVKEAVTELLSNQGYPKLYETALTQSNDELRVK